MSKKLITDAMVRAYKATYLKHCDDALNGRIPRAEDFTFEASRKGIAAALSASPSPVDSRDGLIERLEDAVRIYLEALDSDPEKDVLDEDGVSFASDWSHQKHDAEVAVALDDVRAALAAMEQQGAPVDNRDEALSPSGNREMAKSLYEAFQYKTKHGSRADDAFIAIVSSALAAKEQQP